MVWLPGLERLGDGVGDRVVVFTCCIVRFMPGEAIVVGVCLLGLLSCAGFGGPLGWVGVLCIAEGVSVVKAWKLASDCLLPGHFCMVDLVHGVGSTCIQHNWWGHGFVVDSGSHSWHVHPSTKMSCSIGVG